MGKTPINAKKKAKKKNTLKEFILGHIISSPSFLDFDKEKVDYLIKQGVPENAALELAKVCAEDYEFLSEEDYDHHIGIYNQFVDRGHGPMKSVFLTIAYLRHHFILSLEDAEKEYNKLEERLKDL